MPLASWLCYERLRCARPTEPRFGIAMTNAPPHPALLPLAAKIQSSTLVLVYSAADDSGPFHTLSKYIPAHPLRSATVNQPVNLCHYKASKLPLNRIQTNMSCLHNRRMSSSLASRPHKLRHLQTEDSPVIQQWLDNDPAVIRQWSGSDLAVIRQWSGSDLAVIWLWSGSDLAVIWLWSGSDPAVIWLWSGSDPAVIWLCSYHQKTRVASGKGSEETACNFPKIPLSFFSGDEVRATWIWPWCPLKHRDK